jgi:hypothetical protein
LYPVNEVRFDPASNNSDLLAGTMFINFNSTHHATTVWAATTSSRTQANEFPYGSGRLERETSPDRQASRASPGGVSTQVISAAA